MEWNGEVLDWAKEHNCEYGVAKFQLVDFTRKPHNTVTPGIGQQEPVMGYPIQIGQNLIHP